MSKPIQVDTNVADDARRQRDGRRLFLAGVAIYLIAGSVLLLKVSYRMTDFKVVYFSARCLTHHCDPYSFEDMRRLFASDPDFTVAGHPGVQSVIERYFYPPMTFVATLPFALFPYKSAMCLWLLFSTAAFVVGSWLVYCVAARASPVWAGALAGALVANSAWLFMIGNAAEAAVGLCCIAVWAFLERRWEKAGVFCLILSLLLKPHIAGPVWLYFLFAGAHLRRRAWQTLALILLASVPAVVLTRSASPHWIEEIKSNAAFFAGNGNYADPGLASGINHDIDPVVEMQSIVSVVWQSPAVYNAITYFVCGLLLVLFLAATIRLRPEGAGAWLGVAAVSAMAMLPLYHRQHDARILLLCLPACVAMSREARRAGKIAFALLTAAIILLGDFATAVRVGVTYHWLKDQSGAAQAVNTILFGRPGQLALLALSAFLVAQFMRSAWPRHGLRRDVRPG